ncbi:MAG: DUF1080 domain-containing protein [Opitutaceae bacterium]
MQLRFRPTSLLFLAGSLFAAAPVPNSFGPAFYGDPPDDTHPWGIHDRNRPQPPRVVPGTPSLPNQPGRPPADAIVLFDGTDATLANWQADGKEGGPTKWVVRDGALECVPKSGYIRSKAQFGDCQLHVEWAAPREVKGNSQGRGNSGIFLLGLVEVQVLDNHDNPTYADGFANSVYGTNPPLANPLRPPGEFQQVDIIFRRPVYRDGRVVDPGYLTVFCNGVLVQDHTPLEGPGGHMRRTKAGPFPESGPLKLQDHGNPVRFRNIWYRPLPPRSSESGTDGALTPTATTAKRRAIAAGIRTDAESLQGTERLLRFAESLVYEVQPAAAQRVEELATTYTSGLKGLSSSQLESRKGEILGVLRAFRYLAKHGMIAPGYGPQKELERIERAQGWEEKKK